MTTQALQKRIDNIGKSEVASFSDSFMGDEGCMQVAAALRNHTNVTCLDLRGSNIHSEGATALAQALTENHSLKSIGLEWNSIGLLDSGVSVLSDALARSNSITELDLRNNGISPSGGVAIARALTRNKSLQKLDLRWNNIGVSGGRALADAMQSNKTITELLIAGNKINDDNIRVIEDAVMRNSGGAGGAARSPVRQPVSSPVRSPFSGVIRGDPKEKLVEMSHVLLGEKERFLQMERQYTEDLGAQSREFEKIIEALQGKVAQERHQGEAAQAELQRLLQMERQQLEHEKEARARLENDLRAATGQVSDHDQDHAASMAAMNKRLDDTMALLQDKQKENSVLRREKEALNSQITTLEERLAAEAAKLSEKEHLSRLENQRLSATHSDTQRRLQEEADQRLRQMEERLRSVEQSRVQAEENLKKEREATMEARMQGEERILQAEERLREEEESRLALLDDRIRAIQTARDALQARAEQQAFEIQELRRLESARTKEYETFLKRESQLRTESEQTLVDKTNECETLRASLLRAEHQLSSAEERLARAAQSNQSRAEAHDAQIMKHIEESAADKRVLESRLAEAQERVSASETQLRQKELELVRCKEEEGRRLADLADKITAHVNAELSAAQAGRGR